MFRALGTAVPQVSSQTGPLTMQPPPSASLTNGSSELKPVQLAIEPSGVFSTSVGASSKKTLATWHVTTPAEVVDAMLALVNDKSHL